MPSNRHRTRYWRMLPDGRIECRLCPHQCKLVAEARGLCFIRRRVGDELVLDSYGRSTGFCIDPVEKKPLHHFLPGTPVLSFGTAGCNLSCRFCQNWETSKAREIERRSAVAEPAVIARSAAEMGCSAVAYTYNDPVIFLEYAVDTAAACAERGIRSIAVTAGYIEAAPRAEFFGAMDAANVDLKSFDPDFYRRLTGSRLEPVLETLEYLSRETDCWLEITTLLIPGENDGEAELTALVEWVHETLGPETPLHFSAFHPDFRMRDTPPTPVATLTRARRLARGVGLRHVYTGNIRDREGASTCCSGCGELLIERDLYSLGTWGLDAAGRCNRCGKTLAGVFAEEPGSWGARCLPLDIQPG